jgi:hypothetical protein
VRRIAHALCENAPHVACRASNAVHRRVDTRALAVADACAQDFGELAARRLRPAVVFVKKPYQIDDRSREGHVRDRAFLDIHDPDLDRVAVEPRDRAACIRPFLAQQAFRVVRRERGVQRTLGAQMTKRRLQLMAPRLGEMTRNSVRAMPAAPMLLAAGAVIAGAYLFRRNSGSGS